MEEGSKDLTCQPSLLILGDFCCQLRGLLDHISLIETSDLILGYILDSRITHDIPFRRCAHFMCYVNKV
jgi:hypothetical protein